VLHKELDPDDDELTRTRKVRRNFIAEKYAVLIDALYEGKASQYIETQVKFEDGRSGMVRRPEDRRLQDLSGRAGCSLSASAHDQGSHMLMNEPETRFERHRQAGGGRKIGPVILDLQDISLSFGGVRR
jgi:hypothetical protein